MKIPFGFDDKSYPRDHNLYLIHCSVLADKNHRSLLAGTLRTHLRILLQNTEDEIEEVVYYAACLTFGDFQNGIIKGGFDHFIRYEKTPYSSGLLNLMREGAAIDRARQEILGATTSLIKEMAEAYSQEELEVLRDATAEA